ncbi:hypothetical protein [Cerasicoccus arenae]|uniref:Uncharacterized protein n=1 Tax=Cerasicoccus arenae TaxID=424488 RepID=A0A8J3GBG6_9BACT|nr:hypothetical protein [Cerasicoccus arenae]MBK1858318.1 hypothetical protein [Cerasicoccus arenae]GHB90742.1 hypothetical protein GCM10007047_01940 [Cerasicoccus arenae]
MNKRYITHASSRLPVRELTEDERKLLRKNFSPLAARRLTSLSLILGDLTKDAPASPDDEWIFASSYGGSISLEQYLRSFPNPSPLHFQNSIQPGPIDLVNVARQQPARQLIPLIGAENLLGEALLTALISPVDTMHLIGGEEHTNWAADHQLGSQTTYGFYLRLSTAPQNTIGELTFEPNTPPPSPLSTEDAIPLLDARKPLAFTLPERGVIRLQWS